MLMPQKLDEMRRVDVNAVDKGTLTDVTGLIFDASIPPDKRAERVLTATKNPYCFRVGDMGVKLEFQDNAPPLQNRFSDFLGRKKNGL